MKLSLLIKRPGYVSEFVEALSRCVHYATGRVVDARLMKLPVFSRRRWVDAGWALFCQPRLNFIASPGLAGVATDIIRNEYGRHPSRLRTLFQRPYVWLALSRVGQRVLASHAIVLGAPLGSNKHLMIIPGRHRVRIVDVAAGTAFVVAMGKRDAGSMETEIEFRRRRAWLPAPALLEADHASSRFTEEVVIGTPTNRARLTRTSWGLVRARLVEWAQARKAESFQLPFRGARAEATSRVLAAAEGLHGVVALRQWLEEIGRIDVGQDEPATMVPSHGDFQPGNVLVREDGALWVIDWESAAVRSIGYDPICYAIGARTGHDLQGMLREFVHRGYDPGIQPDVSVLDGCHSSRAERRVAAVLFALEEAEYRLHEIRRGGAASNAEDAIRSLLSVPKVLRQA